MFVISNLLAALAKILGIIVNIYTWVIIINALISWVGPDPHNPIVRFLNAITEPVLGPARRFLYRYFPSLSGAMGIDFSPVIVILILIFIDSFVVNTLIDIAVRLK